MPAALFTARQNAPSPDGSLTGAGPLGSHSKASQDGEMPLRSGELASPCIPGLPAENGRSGRNDGRRRRLEASAQEKWFSGAL